MNEVKEMNKVETTEQKETKVTSWDEALEKEAWVSPMINIYETDDDFVLETYMPGVTKENLKIKYEDGAIVLMGRINYDEVMNRKYVLREMEIGNYYRKLNLSDSIDESKIEAHFENGLLTLHLPKHERIKPRTIEIS
ncbi:MAG: Hsp20/alpha crystallin family protein [Ignavibacteria bacterium]|nr:MAG: Hsp20/alpha crystallin family protein [Ignavibacteria bacterium]